MRILILLCVDIKWQQRIGKEIETLVSAGHQVNVLELPSRHNTGSQNYGVYELQEVRLLTRGLPSNLLFWPFKFLEMSLRFLIEGSRIKPDIVHCVDRIPLLSAFLIAQRMNISYIYDSQEIHSGVESSANKPKWFWLWMEKALAKRASRILVTDHFRLDLTANILELDKSKFYVLMNLPKKSVKGKVGRRLRDECPWQNGKIAVYAGAISPNRHIEDIVKSLVFLPSEYRITLVGVGESWFMTSLMSLARRLEVGDRLVILPPVKWSELPQYIASVDCAFVFYEKNSLNNYYCSPSKLFDALMAGLPVISSDNPLVVEIVQQHDAGMCIGEVNPETISAAVQRVLGRKDLQNMKSRLEAIAREKYNWETQEPDFIRFYSEVEAEMRASGNQ